MTEKTPAVYAGINSVREALNSEGIAKDREVTDGVRFKFRGIDDVLDSFSGPLVKAKLITVPSYSGLVVTERPTKTSRTYNSQVACEIRITSLVDGSTLVLGPFYGEANDTQDKSAAKAQSIAYRIGMLLSFTVPLGAEMDPEMGDSAGAEPVKSDKPKPRAVEGEVMDRDGGDREAEPITQAQDRILRQKCKTAGIDISVVEGEIGAIGKHNFNAALDFVKRQSNA